MTCLRASLANAGPASASRSGFYRGATTTIFRGAIREKYGRRGKAGDPAYGIKHLLERNLENLSPDNFAEIIDTLDASAVFEAKVYSDEEPEQHAKCLNLPGSGGSDCSPGSPESWRAELAEDPVAEDLRAMFAPFGTRFPAVSRDISLLATHPAA